MERSTVNPVWQHHFFFGVCIDRTARAVSIVQSIQCDALASFCAMAGGWPRKAVTGASPTSDELDLGFWVGGKDDAGQKAGAGKPHRRAIEHVLIELSAQRPCPTWDRA